MIYSCGKTTWYGCGQHIPSVMDPLQPSEKCTCENHNPCAPGTAPPKPSHSPSMEIGYE